MSAKNDADFFPAIRDRGVTVTGDQAALVIDIHGGGMRWVGKQDIDNGLVVVRTASQENAFIRWIAGRLDGLDHPACRRLTAHHLVPHAW